MIKFEKWISEQDFSEYAVKIFNEAIMCYKVGAYRSAFIDSYIGFYIVIKDRVMIRQNSKPNYIEKNKWEKSVNGLKNEESWEKLLHNYIKDKSEESIFKLNDEIRTDLESLRIKRNKIVHGINEEISPIQVEYLWEEIIQKYLNRFYVGGGIEYIKELVCNSFDLRKKRRWI